MFRRDGRWEVGVEKSFKQQLQKVIRKRNLNPISLKEISKFMTFFMTANLVIEDTYEDINRIVTNKITTNGLQ
jgi:hypothetical protein